MEVKELLQTIGERLGAGATVKAVYGEPVVAEGRVVVPVANVRYGFGAGGGSGSSDDDKGEGSGGGGGVTASPAGMIEIDANGARFHVFPDYRKLGVAVGVGVLLGLFLARRSD